jgi:hypothetical protein
MTPTSEIARQIAQAHCVTTSKDEDRLCEAITAALDKERQRAEKYKKALEEIATYKVTDAKCTYVDKKNGVINFTSGPTHELYDERAEIAREALKEVKDG